MSNLRGKVWERLQEVGPSSPRSFVDDVAASTGAPVREVRDAVWRMLGDGSVLLTPAAKLSAAPEPPGR